MEFLALRISIFLERGIVEEELVFFFGFKGFLVFTFILLSVWVKGRQETNQNPQHRIKRG